jgi:hypothetical protein
VICKQQEPGGAQHPVHLDDCAALVGDSAQRECADHGVETGIGERQREGVCLAEVHGTAEIAGPAAREGEHGGAEVDSGQLDLGGIERRPV